MNMVRLQGMPVILALLAAAVLTAGIISGCGQLGGDQIVDEGTAVITQPTSDGPIAVTPNSTSNRVITTNLSMQLPASGLSEMSLSIAPQDLNVAVSTPGGATGGGNLFVITLSFGATNANDPCATATTPVEFMVGVDSDGMVKNVEPSRVSLDAGTIALLQTGEVSLCTTIEANFVGSVAISNVTAAFPTPGASIGNDNGTSNANSNDNSGNISNDNASANGNDNASINGNDNVGENENDNADDDENDNGDDNDNDNTSPNGNDNDDDDDSSSNSNSSNANANHNDNQNDNSGGNDNGDDDDDDRNDNEDDD